jgi:hypothetical protein
LLRWNVFFFIFDCSSSFCCRNARAFAGGSWSNDALLSTLCLQHFLILPILLSPPINLLNANLLPLLGNQIHFHFIDDLLLLFSMLLHQLNLIVLGGWRLEIARLHEWRRCIRDRVRWEVSWWKVAYGAE